MTLTLALSYGGREEIAHAARELAKAVAAGPHPPRRRDARGAARAHAEPHRRRSRSRHPHRRRAAHLELPALRPRLRRALLRRRALARLRRGGPLRGGRELPGPRASLRARRREPAGAPITRIADLRRSPARSDGRRALEPRAALRDGRRRRARHPGAHLRRAAVGVLPARARRGARRRAGALRDDAPGRPRRRRRVGVLVVGRGVASPSTCWPSDPRVLVTRARRRARSSARSSRSRASASIETAALRACALGFGPLFVAVPLTLLALMRKTLGGRGLGLRPPVAGARVVRRHGRLLRRALPRQAQALRGGVAEEDASRARSAGSLASVVWALLGVASGTCAARCPSPTPSRWRSSAGALGQAGDLGESLLKRSTGREGLRRHRPGPRGHPRPGRRPHRDVDRRVPLRALGTLTPSGQRGSRVART